MNFRRTLSNGAIADLPEVFLTVVEAQRRTMTPPSVLHHTASLLFAAGDIRPITLT